MKFILSLFVLLVFVPMAQAAVEEDYTHAKPLAVIPWYGRVTEERRAADLEFIAGMRPHHAGAIPMSQEYLGDPDASNTQLKQLAKGIIHNQSFEIEMLDETQAQLNKNADDSYGQIATKRLAQNRKFVRKPMPGPLDAWTGERSVSARDVAFAKAMIEHHEGALDMANNYLSKESADNGYLERLCLDILVDQKQEIAFMESIMRKYEGDIASVKPSPIYGMEHMNHSKSHTKAVKAPEKTMKSSSAGTDHSQHH